MASILFNNVYPVTIDPTLKTLDPTNENPDSVKNDIFLASPKSSTAITYNSTNYLVHVNAFGYSIVDVTDKLHPTAVYTHWISNLKSVTGNIPCFEKIEQSFVHESGDTVLFEKKSDLTSIDVNKEAAIILNIFETGAPYALAVFRQLEAKYPFIIKYPGVGNAVFYFETDAFYYVDYTAKTVQVDPCTDVDLVPGDLSLLATIAEKDLIKVKLFSNNTIGIVYYSGADLKFGILDVSDPGAGPGISDAAFAFNTYTIDLAAIGYTFEAGWEKRVVESLDYVYVNDKVYFSFVQYDNGIPNSAEFFEFDTVAPAFTQLGSSFIEPQTSQPIIITEESPYVSYKPVSVNSFVLNTEPIFTYTTGLVTPYKSHKLFIINPSATFHTLPPTDCNQSQITELVYTLHNRQEPALLVDTANKLFYLYTSTGTVYGQIVEFNYAVEGDPFAISKHSAPLHVNIQHVITITRDHNMYVAWDPPATTDVLPIAGYKVKITVQNIAETSGSTDETTTYDYPLLPPGSPQIYHFQYPYNLQNGKRYIASVAAVSPQITFSDSLTVTTQFVIGDWSYPVSFSLDETAPPPPTGGGGSGSGGGGTGGGTTPPGGGGTVPPSGGGGTVPPTVPPGRGGRATNYNVGPIRHFTSYFAGTTFTLEWAKPGTTDPTDTITKYEFQISDGTSLRTLSFEGITSADNYSFSVSGISTENSYSIIAYGITESNSQGIVSRTISLPTEVAGRYALDITDGTGYVSSVNEIVINWDVPTFSKSNIANYYAKVVNTPIIVNLSKGVYTTTFSPDTYDLRPNTDYIVQVGYNTVNGPGPLTTIGTFRLFGFEYLNKNIKYKKFYPYPINIYDPAESPLYPETVTEDVDGYTIYHVVKHVPTTDYDKHNERCLLEHRSNNMVTDAISLAESNKLYDNFFDLEDTSNVYKTTRFSYWVRFKHLPIQPGSLKVTTKDAGSPVSFTDDGQGHLMSPPSYDKCGNFLESCEFGFIDYDSGILSFSLPTGMSTDNIQVTYLAVTKNPNDESAIWFPTPFTGVTLNVAEPVNLSYPVYEFLIFGLNNYKPYNVVVDWIDINVNLRKNDLTNVGTKSLLLGVF